MNKTNKKHSFAVVAVVMIITAVGISLAWFYQHAAMSTLMNIVPPDSISIVPVDGDGNDSSMLDLDFKEGDIKGEDGTITIRRPIYVYSTSPVHQLEIVHTTNMNELSFAVYPATINADGKTFTYDGNHCLSGEYKNQDDNTSLAVQDKLNNYKKDDNVEVEAHAYPLYWLAGNSGDKTYVADSYITNEVTSIKEPPKFDPAKQVYKTYYKTYYMVEISWKEDSKETDLFYVMAQNCAVTAIEGSES